MSLKSLRHRCEYGALVLAMSAMRLAGVDASASVLAWLARLIGPRTRRHGQSLRNLAIAFPDRSPAEHARIAHAMWDNMGRIAAELMLIDRVIADPARIDIRGTQGLEAAVRERVPQVGATPHLGNWELTIWPVKLLGGDPAAVYRPLANPYIDRLVRSRRTALFSGGLFAKGKEDGPRAAKGLIDFVRGGGWLGFVCDHVDRRGVDVTFLGQSVRVSYVPALIARHTDAWLWVARTVRLGAQSRFRLDAVRLDMPVSDDKRRDAHRATELIFRQFDAWIREHPEQWQWWNIRPPRASGGRTATKADAGLRALG
ncbi:LpxL/LpxP family acyltransferase [Hyphomicrobium sp.]|uniref:LpxL/LpxP family acyltransferase n=1 Tax=Hyphomicrobium sp. TaxID=82 RepID=UPI002FDF4D58